MGAVRFILTDLAAVAPWEMVETAEEAAHVA